MELKLKGTAEELTTNTGNHEKTGKTRKRKEEMSFCTLTSMWGTETMLLSWA